MTTGSRQPVLSPEHRQAALVPRAAGRRRAWRSTRQTPHAWASSRAIGYGFALGRGPRGCRPVLRHQGRHHQRQPRVVVPRDGHRIAWLLNSSASTAAWTSTPSAGCAAPRSCAASRRVYKATPENCRSTTRACDPDGNPAITNANDPRLKEWAVQRPAPERPKVELTYASAPQRRAASPHPEPRRVRRRQAGGLRRRRRVWPVFEKSELGRRKFHHGELCNSSPI